MRSQGRTTKGRKRKIGKADEKRIGEIANIVYARSQINKRLLLGIPSTGIIRIEWYFSMMNAVFPVNWSMDICAPYTHAPLFTLTPVGFAVDHARNVCASAALKLNVDWLLFIDHDVLVPPDTFVKFSRYMISKEYPIVSGLYGCKAVPSDPLIFRGRGNGYFADWKFGDKVEVDGVVMGCTLIHREILEVVRDFKGCYSSDEFKWAGMERLETPIWQIFETPRLSMIEPETGNFKKQVGTEDLYFCDTILENNLLAKTKCWKHLAKKKYPFLTDTSIFCKHIDSSGVIYPTEAWERHKP